MEPPENCALILTHEGIHLRAPELVQEKQKSPARCKNREQGAATVLAQLSTPKLLCFNGLGRLLQKQAPDNQRLTTAMQSPGQAG